MEHLQAEIILEEYNFLEQSQKFTSEEGSLISKIFEKNTDLGENLIRNLLQRKS